MSGLTQKQLDDISTLDEMMQRGTINKQQHQLAVNKVLGISKNVGKKSTRGWANMILWTFFILIAIAILYFDLPLTPILALFIIPILLSIKKRGTNSTGIPGLSFSLNRALGITNMKSKIARATGIPTTKSGRQRKIGKLLGIK